MAVKKETDRLSDVYTDYGYGYKHNTNVEPNVTLPTNTAPASQWQFVEPTSTLGNKTTTPTNTSVGANPNISFDPEAEFATNQDWIDSWSKNTGLRNLDYTQDGRGYSDFSNIDWGYDPTDEGGDRGNNLGDILGGNLGTLGGGGGSSSGVDGGASASPVYNSQYAGQIADLLKSIQSNNGQYNLPEYSSQYADQIANYLTRVQADSDTPYNLPTWNEQFSYDPYNSRYQGTIDDLANQIANRKFEYDYKNDPMYQQMQDSYMRNGQRAMQDTLGQLSARTGGLASSYAGSMAQQSYNNYMMNLADRIPELQKLAYSMYQDEGNNMRNNLSMYQGLDNTDYGRYKDAYNMASNEYDRRYGEFSDNWNREYKTQVDQREANRNMLNTLQNLENGDYGRYQDAYNNAMNLQAQKNADDYKLLNLLQGMDQDEYQRWKQQLGL